MVVRYKIVIADSAKKDIIQMKKYILKHFYYRELAEDFSKKIKSILGKLDTFPRGHQPTDFIYRGYTIYIVPRNTYLIFYTVSEVATTVTILRVLKDSMDWQQVIKRWLTQNE